LPTPFYIDSDDDEVGSGPAKPFCVAAGTKTYAEAGVKHVLVGGDECPDVKGVLKPKVFYLDTDQDELGDPNEPTQHCGLTLAGRVDNAADPDDRVADPSNKPKAQDAAAVPPDEDPVKAAEKKMKAIVSKCRDVRNEILALPTKQKYLTYTSDLGAQLAELHEQLLLVLDLQKQLHDLRRQKSGETEVTPHGFVAKLWPVCTSPKCRLNIDLVREWRAVLEVLREVSLSINDAEKLYLQAAKDEGVESTGINDRNPETLMRKVKEAFFSAKKKCPGRLLDVSSLDEELKLLDKREKDAS